MDLDTLSLRPQGYFGSYYFRFDNDYLSLIDESGQEILKVGKKSENISIKKFYWSPPFIRKVDKTQEIEFDESVEEAIKRIGDKVVAIRYIVKTLHDKFGFYVYIYKLPKSVTDMRTWLNQKAVEASENLRQVLNG